MLTKTRKAYFKKLLTQMLDEALATDKKSVEDANGIEGRRLDFSDRAMVESDSAFSLRMQERKRGLVRKIEEALGKIEISIYGICEKCEEEISEDRLEARPVTTLCIDCKRKEEEIEQIME